jgi:hypothetical protein
MPEYDHDLIAALADGRLDHEQAAAAERVIAADPAATAALAQHRRAVEAVRAIPPAALTDPERAHIRMAVAEAIGLDRSPVAASSGRRTPWGAISIAAATLAALVAVIPIAGLLTSGADESSAVSAGMAEVDASARSGDDVDAAPTAAVDTTSQATETAGGSTTAGPLGYFEDSAAADADIEQTMTALEADPAGGEEKSNPPTAETLCATEASDQIGAPVESLRFIETTVGDQQVLVFFTLTDGALDAAAAYAPADCALLAARP